MAWRNRMSMKGRSQGFRKMSAGGDDDDYDMPLLVRSSSLSPQSNNSNSCINPPKSLNFAGFKSPKSNQGMNTNIAAVSDDDEALEFPEHKYHDDSHRSSNNVSPVSIVEHNPFVAQFDPEVIRIIDEKEEDSKEATVFDDNDSNDLSVYSNGKQNDEAAECRSLRPPSITVEATSTDKNSKTGSNSRQSPSSHDEDADAATWKADEIDAFVDAAGFSKPAINIGGVDLLTERDNSVNELQEANHLMTFNALVLIQKQKDWIEGSIDATKGANKGSSALISMELENLERKIKLLMDSKTWPNELERRKQEANPFTPSKAFFKSMALIDKSIQQFHKGYMTYMSETSQDNHELKVRIDKLVEVNASLQEQAARSMQKTETIRKLQKEREDLTRTVDSTEHILSSLLINAGRENTPSKKDSSKINSVKSYIQRLETEREVHLAEIQSLKRSVRDGTESNSVNDETAQASSSSLTLSNEDEERKASLDDSDSSDAELALDDENVILDGDLGSKWNTLEKNELEMASKDDQIKSLTKTVTGQESALAEVRAECKLMKSQLEELILTRNEFQAKCESKDAALTISQDRISSLEEEVLRAHAEVANYEEDYEAMRESFSSQKVATKQEITNSQDEVKAQIEQIREEFKEKLRRSEDQLNDVKEDRDRVIRDLKKSVEEMEADRDNLKSLLSTNTVFYDAACEEKKESDEDLCVVPPPAVVSPQSSGEADFDQMRNRFVEKASKQAYTIAQLTEENEMKDEQLKSLHEMVEMLLGKRNGEGEDEGGKRQWGKRLSNLRASMNRSRHGSIGGSQHGGTWHGSLHGDPTN